MTLTQTICPNCTAFRAGKQGILSAEVEALAPVLEKSTTELRLKSKQNFLDPKTAQTLNRIGQLPELTASAADHNIDIVCLQEHRYDNSELELKYNDTCNILTFESASAWICRYRRDKNASQSSYPKITE